MAQYYFDRYNNRPPFRKIAVERSHDFNSLTSFQHRAFINSIKRNPRPKSDLQPLRYTRKTSKFDSYQLSKQLPDEIGNQKEPGEVSERRSRLGLFTEEKHVKFIPKCDPVLGDAVVDVIRHEIQRCPCEKRRPSSVPSSERCGITKCRNPREVELFNPDYNFSKKKTEPSLIESIRKKVLFQGRPNYDQGDSWDDGPPVEPSVVTFPKETRNAMTVLNSFLRPNCMTRTSETQTSPTMSTTRVYPAFKIPKEFKKVPCPKNLLCEKGLHSGKCGRTVLEKHKVTLTRNDVRPTEQGLVSEEASVENFLKIMEPKRDKSLEGCPIMNGLNGHANGDLSCGDIITQNQQKGCWTIGLINSKYRYLTAETFGFKINANGTSLKKKQIWTLEPDLSNVGESMIYLRSHLDKYLAVDSFGNITCESEDKDPGCKFQISVAEDGSGRWALKNVVRGYFLGSSSDKLTCTAKVPGEAEFWHVHLAARPQMNLRSVGRKRFAHLSENLDEIHVDANIPWGEDTLFTLEFRADESGKYALHTCNNKYLSLGGKLVDTCTKDCLFSAEYHSGQLALRDRTGAYLSPIGSKAVLKTRSQTVTKDELFSLEDSLPQASFVAALNNKFVSVKQGVDVTANQDEISDHETFQLEFDWSTKRWYIRTMQDKYWTLETGGGIQAAGDKRSSNALFDLIWQKDGSVAFRANNGRYVITKRSGHLYATADSVDDNCKYFFYLVNRPILVLKCEQGFVGYKSASSPKLECNKATYETIQVERGEKGVVYFKGQNGKYWHVDSEGVSCDSDTPEGFYLELREPTRLCIKTTNGNYLTASKNGCFRLGDSSIESATQWEY